MIRMSEARIYKLSLTPISKHISLKSAYIITASSAYFTKVRAETAQCNGSTVLYGTKRGDVYV